MKTIIVPVDFSAEALVAAHYACRMAQNIGAAILLVHFLPLPLMVADVPLPIEGIDSTSQDAESSIALLKEKLLTCTKNELSITTQIYTQSFTAYLITLDSEGLNFAMVMGAKGRGRSEAFLLGSFSLVAVKHCRVPLIIVPKEYVYKTIKKIGFACDMKRSVDTLPLGQISSMIELFSTTIEIVYISDPNKRISPDVLIESKALLNKLANFNPHISIQENKALETGLVLFSLKESIDMMIIIHKDRGGFEKIIHRSFGKEMALHTKIPVMLLHES